MVQGARERNIATADLLNRKTTIIDVMVYKRLMVEIVLRRTRANEEWGHQHETATLWKAVDRELQKQNGEKGEATKTATRPDEDPALEWLHLEDRAEEEPTKGEVEEKEDAFGRGFALDSLSQTA